MTTTKPTSQRLAEVCKEKGITIESEKVWADFSEFNEGWILESENPDGMPSIPALSFDEAWALLPMKIKHEYWLGQNKQQNGDTCLYYEDNDNNPIKHTIHESPAEAATLLLIWVIENGYWKEGK